MAEAKHESMTVATPGEHAAESGTFPPFDPTNFVPLLIWLVLTFGVLYLLMSKVALPRVHDILATRMGKINADIMAATHLREEANQAGAAYDKTLADAKGRSQALAQETQASLAAEADAKRHGLEAELNAKLAAAEAQIVTMKDKAMASVDEIARETTAVIVQRITGRPADAAAVAAAVGALKA